MCNTKFNFHTRTILFKLTAAIPTTQQYIKILFSENDCEYFVGKWWITSLVGTYGLGPGCHRDNYTLLVWHFGWQWWKCRIKAALFFNKQHIWSYQCLIERYIHGNKRMQPPQLCNNNSRLNCCCEKCTDFLYVQTCLLILNPLDTWCLSSKNLSIIKTQLESLPWS